VKEREEKLVVVVVTKVECECVGGLRACAKKKEKGMR